MWEYFALKIFFERTFVKSEFVIKCDIIIIKTKLVRKTFIRLFVSKVVV